MLNIRVLLSTFKLHLTQSFARGVFRFCIIVQPLLYTFILYMMYKGSSHSNYVNYVVLGSENTSPLKLLLLLKKAMNQQVLRPVDSLLINVSSKRIISFFGF